MMHSVLTLFFALGMSGILAAQPTLWEDIPLAQIRNADQRTLRPDRFRTVRLDVERMRNILDQVPSESGTPIRTAGTLLSVPNPDGGMDTFRIVEYHMMEPGLAQRYPGIKTFRGVHIRDPLMTIRCDWTWRGFSAIVRSRGERYHVEPILRGNREDFIIFYKKDYPLPANPFHCGVERVKTPDGIRNDQRATGDCVFRSYRLALAASGDYSNYFGADGPEDEEIVLSEVVIAVNRVNGVLEEDLTVRLILVENTTEVFYYNPNTDPYMGDACAILDQNQSNLDVVIGSENYDIGHVFSIGVGGCAGLAVICDEEFKGWGATGQMDPLGDPFYIDFVAHEIGHQLGAEHTQNNNCNRSFPASKEPGSASTIMGYAGICSPNIQAHSDDYFHGYSIQEINNYIAGGFGNSCDVPISFDNQAPEVTPLTDYTIPKSTPFILTVNASDPDDDPLTYCWEQWDPQFAPMPPLPTNTTGPMFRSFTPDTSPTRYFPRLSDLVENEDYDWEVLPSVSRSMEFRVTVRDFHNGMAGCTDQGNLFVTTTDACGPFVVTRPNADDLVWLASDLELITWDVANTNNAPVNCAEVDILLSYDGGLTYPEVLAAGVPNDGSHHVFLPADTSATCRIMVRCSDNIFFDISDEDFAIETGMPGYALIVSPPVQAACPPETLNYLVMIESILLYDEPVFLSAAGNPSGTSISFSPNPVVPGNQSVMTIVVNDNAHRGEYPLVVSGNSLAGPEEALAGIVILTESPNLVSPADGATGVPLQPLLSWDTIFGSPEYEVQVASDVFFSHIEFSAIVETAAVTSGPLSRNTIYYWRVRALSPCSTSEWSEIRIFQTANCLLQYSTDVPKIIPPNGQPTVTSVLNFEMSGPISDINVVDLEGEHTWLGDLRFSIRSPELTQIILINYRCTEQDNFDVNLDDEAPPGPLPCPYDDGEWYQPSGSLAEFDNQDAQGTWTLIVQDRANGDGGTLESWAVEICFEETCPLTVSNNWDSGPGSLRATLNCAQDGDTIRFAEGLGGHPLTLESTLTVDEDVFILWENPSTIMLIDGSQIIYPMEISSGATVGIQGLTFLAGTDNNGSGIINHGDLLLRDVVVHAYAQALTNRIVNYGSLTLEGNCKVSN